MKKRILSILLALCMLFCLVPTTAFAEGETNRKVETEQELVDALADSSVDIITLKNDIAIGTTLTVLRKVTLDLNGYVLKMTGSGSVIILDNKSGITGDLTLIDSNPTAEHKFKVNGVEPWVLDDSGTETVYGGIITGGTGSRIFFSNGVEGGGVIIGSGALTMNGGNIVGCIANEGGGLFLSDGSFTMNAGSIVGCSTPNRLTTGEASYGGIYAFGPMANIDTTGVITLTGGLIKNNGRYAINAAYMTTIYANGGEVYGGVHLNQACKITCLAEDNGITAFKGKTVIGGTSSVNPSHVDWGLFYGGLYIYGNTTGVIVTYKDGDSEYAKQVLPSGTLATRPDTPAATPGYTFGGWNKADGTAWDYASDKVTDNITLYAKWAANTYTITFDTAGGSEIAPITQDYGTNIAAPADPTREGYTFIGWDKAIPTTMPAENITVTAQWKDSEKPTGEIKINENSWKAFLNNITFGLFFKDTQTVTITAADNSGETVTVEYLLSDKELTKAELDGMTFTAYTAPFGIDPDNEYIIYVRLTDKAGNTDYICSDGIVLDGTSPVITGIEDGKTYCEAQTVTITEKYVDTVTVNGTAVTLDATGSFTLAPADGEQKIVVTDKADNTAEMTVTVNDGHTFGEWTSNGDGTHTRQCTADGCTEGIETDNCTDEDKNHICDICGNIISNHEDANQDHVCDLCGKVISNHEDANKDHVCDYCEKVISNHEDADKDHICDFCGKTISNHDDADNNHICDYCGKTISNHEDADKDHVCDHCGKVISNHEDANKDHVCELCGKTISNHEDADKDHVCDYCGKVITNHIGGKETCRDKAVCEVCGKSYGKLDPKNHTDLKHFPVKAATEDADGNIEYWYCSGCNKYYSDKDGTKEIAKADTVTAKLPKSPPTGDTSNLMLWLALLFVSGGVLTGVTVFDKRKRHSDK